MENPFCVAKKELIQIFWGGTARDRISTLLKKFPDKSLEEIFEQMKTEKGEIGEYIKKENEEFAKKTANDEIVNAITLADFYFRDSHPMVCFEMKSGFRQKEISNYQELIKNLESNSEIDFLIKDKQKEFKFQLKQYPEKYKRWSVDKVIEYLEKSILPESKYNNEYNKDLIIVITIKPERKSGFKEVQDFDKIHKYLSGQKIKLLEINFLYNKNNEHMVWFQVFPENGHYKIPWQKLSYHLAKR